MIIEIILGILVVVVTYLFFSRVRKENDRINNMWNGEREDE